MRKWRPGKATKTKHVVHLIMSTILGFLLSLIAHGLIETNYLNSLTSKGELARFYGGCALHPAIQSGILATGLILGFLAGRIWWRILYVERKWEKKV